MSEEQRNVMYALIGQALEDVKHGEDAENQNENNGEGEDNEMKHNVFENDNNKQSAFN